MSKQENILSKQVRFLRQACTGLSLYTVQQPSELMTCCPPTDKIFGGLGIIDFDHQTKSLPSSPDSLVKILTIIFLQQAFRDPTRLLRHIKQFAYDEKIPLAVKPLYSIPQEYHSSYNEQGLRKMLVQLFHLIQSSNKANKVADYLSKHPFALCILQTLFVHILKSTIKEMDVTLQQVISHLCQALQVNYEKLKDGIFRIGSRGYIASNNGNLYKLCLLDQPSDSEDLNDSSFSIIEEPISRRITESGEKNTTFTYSPIRQRATQSIPTSINSTEMERKDSSNHDQFQASTSTESASLPSLNKQNYSTDNVMNEASIMKPSAGSFGYNSRPITHFQKVVSNPTMKMRPNVSFTEQRLPPQSFHRHTDSSQKRQCPVSANPTTKVIHAPFNTNKNSIQVIKSWPRTTSQDRIVFHLNPITPPSFSSFWIEKGYGMSQPSTPMHHHTLNFPYFYQPVTHIKPVSNPHIIHTNPVGQSRIYISRAMSPIYQESRNI